MTLKQTRGKKNLSRVCDVIAISSKALNETNVRDLESPAKENRDDLSMVWINDIEANQREEKSKHSV